MIGALLGGARGHVNYVPLKADSIFRISDKPKKPKSELKRVRRRPWRKPSEWDTLSSDDSTSDSYAYVDPSLDGSDSEEKQAEQRATTTYGALSIHSVLQQEQHNRFDAQVRFLNLVIAAVAALGVFFMMAEVYLGWDTVEMVFVETHTAFALKASCTAATGALLLLILAYYRLQLSGEKHSWHVADDVVWRQHYRWFLAAELFICSIHTFPEFGMAIYDDRIGAVMLARMYLLVRVFRDHAPVYRKRLELLRDDEMRLTGATNFNWHLAVKITFDNHVWVCTLVGIAVTWFTMGYVIWLCERPAWVPPKQPFTLVRALWLVSVTMTTVGYGDEVPLSLRGRIATAMTAVLGLCNTAFVVFAFLRTLEPGTQDLRVIQATVRLQAFPDIRVKCAEYIALWFSWYVARNDMATRGVKPASDEYASRLASFNYANKMLMTLIRDLRRTVSEVLTRDEVVISRLSDRFSSWTGFMGLKMSRIMGVKRSAKTEGPMSLPALPALLDQVERIEVVNREINRRLDRVALMVAGRNPDGTPPSLVASAVNLLVRGSAELPFLASIAARASKDARKDAKVEVGKAAVKDVGNPRDDSGTKDNSGGAKDEGGTRDSGTRDSGTKESGTWESEGTSSEEGRGSPWGRKPSPRKLAKARRKEEAIIGSHVISSLMGLE